MTEFNGEKVRSGICGECPWSRDAAPGWLGPFSVEKWIMLARSDEPIACHKTIREGDGWDGASQCRGAAIFRKHMAKSPRDSRIAVGPENREQVFSTHVEFSDHHKRLKKAASVCLT